MVWGENLEWLLMDKGVNYWREWKVVELDGSVDWSKYSKNHWIVHLHGIHYGTVIISQ